MFDNCVNFCNIPDILTLRYKKCMVIYRYMIIGMLLLVGSGCQDPIIDPVAQKEVNPEFANDPTQLTDCEKFRLSINKKIQDYNVSRKREVRDSNNSVDSDQPVLNTYIEYKELKDLFYSPKLGSCVYLESGKTLMRLGTDIEAVGGDWKVIYDTYYMFKVPSHEEVIFNDDLPFLQIVHRGEEYTPENEANEIVSRYK